MAGFVALLGKYECLREASSVRLGFYENDRTERSVRLGLYVTDRIERMQRLWDAQAMSPKRLVCHRYCVDNASRYEDVRTLF